MRRSTILSTTVLALAVAGLGGAPPADAGTVAYRARTVHFDAAPGEPNDVFVAYRHNSDKTQISDAGAVITAQRPCRSIDAHTAVCPVSDGVRLRLGDRDDRATPAKGFRYEDLAIDGGRGDDVLFGEDDDSYVGDRLDGGGGRDQLYGRGGDDRLTDGDQDGGGRHAAPGPDTLDGGSGEDTVTYAQRTRGVRVRTGANADAGERGEHDRLAGIEDVVGGAGRDRLLGGRRGNQLYGESGADVIKGRDGDDELYGGRGDDHLSGGRRLDSLFGGPGTDRFSCGAGSDTTHDVQVREVLPRSCDTVQFTWDGGRFWSSPTYPTRTRTGLRLATDCPAVDFSDSSEGISCRGTITVRKARWPHRLLAYGSFSLHPYDFRFKVPLTRTAMGRRWSTGHTHHPRARVSVRIDAVDTPTRPFEWTIRTPRRGHSASVAASRNVASSPATRSGSSSIGM